jgi:hypothetical protein
MSEERHEKLTIEEIKQRLRTGYTFYPTQPGLQQAARELIRPIVEKMDGQEIIYVCRDAWLMRVDYLEVDDNGFRAVATRLQEIEHPIQAAMTARGKRLQAEAARKSGVPMETGDDGPPPWISEPFEFRAQWRSLRLGRYSIGYAMLCDHFYFDPALVAEVKAALARHASSPEIFAILDRASSKR